MLATASNIVGDDKTMTEIFTKEQLLQIISKLEKLEQDKANIMEDISEVCKEARSHGFDVATIKKVLKIRKMDQGKRQEQEELLELYLNALDIK